MEACRGPRPPERTCILEGLHGSERALGPGPGRAALVGPVRLSRGAGLCGRGPSGEPPPQHKARLGSAPQDGRSVQGGRAGATHSGGASSAGRRGRGGPGRGWAPCTANIPSSSAFQAPGWSQGRKRRGGWSVGPQRKWGASRRPGRGNGPTQGWGTGPPARPRLWLSPRAPGPHPFRHLWAKEPQRRWSPSPPPRRSSLPPCLTRKREYRGAAPPARGPRPRPRPRPRPCWRF